MRLHQRLSLASVSFSKRFQQITMLANRSGKPCRKIQRLEPIQQYFFAKAIDNLIERAIAGQVTLAPRPAQCAQNYYCPEHAYNWTSEFGLSGIAIFWKQPIDSGMGKYFRFSLTLCYFDLTGFFG
jgi:hypothetical protein